MPFIVSAPRLRFVLIANATDSLVEGIERLSRRQEPSDLKFALLHITQALELFLKARLAREHRLLLFVDPGKADSASATVDLRGAIARLRAAGVSLGDTSEVEELARLRNRLQHFEIDVLEEVAELQIGRTFRFLESFLEKELDISLKEKLSSKAYFAAQKAGLDYEAALQLALRKLEDDRTALSEAERERARVLECDFCGQAAILHPNPTTIPPDHVQCYFCDRRHVVSRCGRCHSLTVSGDPCDDCRDR